MESHVEQLVSRRGTAETDNGENSNTVDPEQDCVAAGLDRILDDGRVVTAPNALILN